MISRRATDKLFKIMMLCSVLLILSTLAGIIITVIVKGSAAINFSMLTETPKGGYYMGKEGGIANAIVGSLYLAFGASIIALLISLPAAFALQREYTSRFLSNLTRLILDILWGTPSIVYGVFGFTIMIYFGIRASLFGGIIVLALLMLPIMIRSMEEVIRMVPLELKEISYAMGANRFETSVAVVMRQAFPGIITAVLLAFGRGIGDTASVLFTAGYTDEIPLSLFDPVASLPLAVFFQIGTPIIEVQERAYASALVLLIIVLMVNIISRILGKRYSRNIIR
jgi:phosphate transport system permease protein